MKAIWATAFSFIVAITLLGGFVKYQIDRDRRLDRDLKLISPGASAQEVVRLLGTPNWRAQCGSRFPYGWKKDCKEELVYVPFISPILPAYQVIQVGLNGHVLSVDLIQSP